MRFFSDDCRFLPALDPKEGAGLRLWQFWDHSLANQEANKGRMSSPTVISPASEPLTGPGAKTTASEADLNSEEKSLVEHTEKCRLILAYVLLQTAPLMELQRRGWDPLAMLIAQV